MGLVLTHPRTMVAFCEMGSSGKGMESTVLRQYWTQQFTSL